MIRLPPIPVPASGGYGAALPGGVFVGHAVDGIRTNRGRVDLPLSARTGAPQIPLAIDLHPGGVRFVCAGADDDQAHEWDGSRYINHGRISGSKPVLYDRDGTLLFVRSPASVGAPSGLRQIDDAGRLVTVEHSRTSSHPYEWTTRQGITIGQGHSGARGEDPCVARMPDGSYRLIQPGKNWHIKFAMIGDDIALAMVEVNLFELYFIWLTRAELDALPRWAPVFTTDPIDPEEPDEPDEPKEPVVSIPDLSRVVRAMHDAHPQLLKTNSPASIAEFYWRAAWALHEVDPLFGFLSKSEGEAHHVVAGVRVAHDAVAYGDAEQCVDIIGNALNTNGSAASPAWAVVSRRSTNVRLPVPRFVEADGGSSGGGGSSSTSDVVSVPTAAAWAAALKRLEAVEARSTAAEAIARQALAQAGGGGGLKYGDQVVIETGNGRVLCFEGAGSNADDEAVRIVSRASDAIGAWETVTLIKP